MPLYINGHIIRHNIKILERICKRPLSFVLKSNAYGLGIENILPLLECERIFLRNMEEAIRARSINTTVQIIVLNSIKLADKDMYEKYNITPIMNDLEDYHKYSEIFNNIPFVLNIDLGMNRSGVSWCQVLQHINLLKSLPITIIMGHLNITHEVVMNSYNLIQKKRFDEVIQLFPSHILKSLASSNVLQFGEEFLYDFPRIGKALYGLIHKDYGLQSALTVEFTIEIVKEVKKGDTVGYNNHKIERDMYVGVVEVGYGQGISLCYMNYGTVLWKNKACKIISISMEYTIIEFEVGIPQVGDVVTFFSDGLVNSSNVYYLEQLLRLQTMEKLLIFR